MKCHRELASFYLVVVGCDITRLKNNSKLTKATANRPSAAPFGSGVALIGVMLVCGEKSVNVVVPSRLILTVTANPLIVSVVSAGMVPALSENILKAKLLPEVDTPSGELRAGP